MPICPTMCKINYSCSLNCEMGGPNPFKGTVLTQFQSDLNQLELNWFGSVNRAICDIV